MDSAVAEEASEEAVVASVEVAVASAVVAVVTEVASVEEAASEVVAVVVASAVEEAEVALSVKVLRLLIRAVSLDSKEPDKPSEHIKYSVSYLCFLIRDPN